MDPIQPKLTQRDKKKKNLPGCCSTEPSATHDFCFARCAGIADFQTAFCITDGRLITGQNPASSTVTGQALLKLFGQKAAAYASMAPALGLAVPDKCREYCRESKLR